MADYDLQYQDTHIDALLATANELKTAGYIYKGVATPSTNPGTPTERVAYLASEPGTYTNFGGIVITSGLYSLTYAGGTWTGTQMQAGSDIEVVQTTGNSTTDVMSQKAVTDEVNGIKESLVDWQYIATTSLTYTDKVYKQYFPFVENSVYKVKVTRVAGTGVIGIYAYRDEAISSNVNVEIAVLNKGVNEKEVEYTANTYQYFGIWATTNNSTAKVEIWLYNGTKIELLDEVAEGMRGVSTISLTLRCIANNFAKVYLPFVRGRQYTINAKKIMATANVGIYAYQLGTTAGLNTEIGVINTRETEKKITYMGSTYPYIGIWSTAAAKIQLEISWYVEDNMTDLLSQDVVKINARTNNSFVNPIILSDNPDPAVWYGEDGYWYLFATGTLATKTMWRSANLVDWENTGETPFTQNAISRWTELGHTTFWAPEVVKVGNKWNLYLSSEKNPMYVFSSNHPTFGYEYVGVIANHIFGGSHENIDACVRYDRDGTLWLFLDGSTIGMYRVKLNEDGTSVIRNTLEHVAGLSMTASGNVSREKTYEGAYLYRRKGYWYLIVSAGQYGNSSYCLRVGRSATLNGTFLDKEGNPMTEGNASLLLSSTGTFYGTGHNGSIITDKNNKTWMLFHSHWYGTTSGARPVCISEVLWDDDGWPYFKDGTLTTYGDGPVM